MRETKVERVIGEYGLDGVGEEMEAHWAGDRGERFSLRELETWFNRRVLRAAMVDAGMNLLDGEVENLHRLLTDKDVSSGVRAEARSRLERQGVDLGQVESDFVTYQAIRTYLKDRRDVTSPTDDADAVTTTAESIQRLEGRMATVAESRIESLRETGQLSVESPRVLTDVSVLCETCGKRYRAAELIEAGECDCGTSD